jgi:hypothetical protein
MWTYIGNFNNEFKNGLAKLSVPNKDGAVPAVYIVDFRDDVNA